MFLMPNIICYSNNIYGLLHIIMCFIENLLGILVKSDHRIYSKSMRNNN